MGLGKVLAAGTALVTSIVLAAPADADEYDYVSVLDSSGIYYSSISDVIDMGKQLCSVGRRAPLTGTAMRQGFAAVLSGGGYTSGTEAAIIIQAAAENMCPDILPRMRAVSSSGSQGVPRTNTTAE